MRHALQQTTDRFLRAQQLRHRATPTERRAWDLLRDRRMLGLKFRRQHPIGRSAILDFYCPALKLALELDGSAHASEQQHERDSDRTNLVRAYGIRVVRIRNEQLNGDTLRRLIKPLMRNE